MPEQKPKLDKFAIAAALQEIAQLMDLRGGKYRFKAKAYNAGARSIQARLGVNTGEVVTGTEERLATGEAENVASRLEHAAPPGEPLRHRSNSFT